MAEAGPSDEELIDGCLRGDGASWETFVERFARLVHWSIRKSAVFVPGDREEFCRETFQEFFRRLLERNELFKLRQAKSVRKFLSVMACHLVMDRQKALSRWTKKMKSVDELAPHEKDASPADGEAVSEADRQESEAALRAALSELSPKERACLEFCIVDGRTAVETGRLLGWPPDTVSSVVRRAKEKLRKKLMHEN